MIDGLAPRRKWLVFALLLLCHVYFFQTYPNFINTNELSRLLLASAIVDYGTLQIDQPLKRFGDNQDKAFYEGHFYSDKPPGTAFLAVPFYWMLKQTGLPFSTRALLFFLRVLCITIPCLLLLNVFTKFWRQLDQEGELLLPLTISYLFGTIAFTYSLELISHYICGALLICSFYYINRTRNVIGGMLAGAAVLLEYPAVIAVVCLLLYAIVKNRPASAWFVLGALPFAVIMLAYQHAIFGNPFELTYRHMTNARQASEYAQGGLGLGLQFPQPAAIWGLLFSMRRGLFVFCPILLFAIPGFYLWMRDRDHRAEAILFVVVITLTVLFYSCLINWDGRWAFGPRYLASIVPFVMTGTIVFFVKQSRFRFLIAPAAILSILIVTIGTVTFPFPPEDIRNPFFILHLPLAIHGAYVQNMGSFLPSIGPLIVFYGLLALTAAVTVKNPIASFTRVVSGIAVAIMILIGGAFISDPPDAFDFFARGSVLFYLGKYDDSIVDLHRALSSNPDDHLQLLIFSRLRQIEMKMR